MEFAPIAPADGYATTAKADYRRKVWDGLERALHHHPLSGFFLIMPSIEGLEIEEAIRRGVPEDRIVALDRDVDVFRRADWVHKYPGVKCVAAEVKDFGSVFPHPICAANLDLCGRFSGETIDQVEGFKAGARFKHPFFFSVNIAKGREDRTTLIMLERIQSSFRGVFSSSRMACLLTLSRINQSGPAGRRGSRCYWEPIDEGEYVSGKHPMTWATMVMANDRTCIAKINRQRFSGGEVHQSIGGRIERDKRPCRRLLQGEINFIKRHAKIGTPGKNGSGNVRQLSAEMGIPYATIYNIIGRNPNWNRRASL